MSARDESKPRQAVFLAPGEGRCYPMGRISAVFKADGNETQDSYSISEWWLEPKTQVRARTLTTRTTSFT